MVQLESGPDWRAGFPMQAPISWSLRDLVDGRPGVLFADRVMVGRVLLGVLKGLLIGGLVSGGVLWGLGVTTFGGPLIATLLAVITGILVGFLAGKPIWASGARIEAYLKAAVGALLAALLMWLVRRYLGEIPDLSSLGIEVSGPVGEIPWLTLPLIGAVLALLFDLDNTGDEEEVKKARVPDAQTKARVRLRDTGHELADEEEDATEVPDRKAERRH